MHRVADTFYKDKDQENIELHLVVPRGLKIATNLNLEVIEIVGCYHKSPKLLEDARIGWMFPYLVFIGVYVVRFLEIPQNHWKTLEIVGRCSIWSLLARSGTDLYWPYFPARIMPAMVLSYRWWETRRRTFEKKEYDMGENELYRFFEWINKIY